MLSKQDQVATDVAVAAQAGRDVNVRYGLDVGEVRELTQIFLDKHMPALRQEAAAIAKENAEAFLNEFTAKLAQPNGVTHEAFAKPDSQACFSRALQASAEKGEKIDLSLLADMVVRRLEVTEDDLLTLVYEEALRVLPKLSAAHISFLSFVHYMRSVRHTKAPDLAYIEGASVLVLKVAEAGFGLSSGNREYLSSLGLLTINLVADANNIMSNMKGNYPFFPSSLPELEPEAPALHRLLDTYGKDSIPTIFLTASGKLIGTLALEKVFGKLNPKVWIQ